MIVGFARISTKLQNLNMQLDALRKAGCEKIFEEIESGAKVYRTQLQMCLNYLRPGDTLMVWALDRLSRNKRECDKIRYHLRDNNITLISISENINSTRTEDDYIADITICNAERERKLMLARSMAGMVAARARGICGGRPFKCDKKKRKAVKDLYDSQKYSLLEIAEMHNISKPTLYRYVREFKNKDDTE